nr:hypothetical protein [Bartonella sp. AU18XJBT]
MSVSTHIEIKETGLEAALSFLQKGADRSMGTLAQGVGRLIQESTRRRIQSGKTTMPVPPFFLLVGRFHAPLI